MSFLLDPPMLVAAGAAIERSSLGERTAFRAERAVAALFIGVSGLLYLNRRVPGFGLVFRVFGARDGRDFMVNSGLLRLRSDDPTPAGHLSAAALFALYPWWVRLGRRIARPA